VEQLLDPTVAQVPYTSSPEQFRGSKRSRLDRSDCKTSIHPMLVPYPIA
jgi:hypothetical protein